MKGGGGKVEGEDLCNPLEMEAEREESQQQAVGYRVEDEIGDWVREPERATETENTLPANKVNSTY